MCLHSFKQKGKHTHTNSMQQIRFKVVSGCLISLLIGSIMGCIIWKFKKLSLWPFDQDSAINFDSCYKFSVNFASTNQPMHPNESVAVSLISLVPSWSLPNFGWIPPAVLHVYTFTLCYIRCSHPSFAFLCHVAPIVKEHLLSCAVLLWICSWNLFYGLVKPIAFGLCLLQ